jgi:hypothetical protein
MARLNNARSKYLFFIFKRPLIDPTSWGLRGGFRSMILPLFHGL